MRMIVVGHIERISADVVELRLRRLQVKRRYQRDLGRSPRCATSAIVYDVAVRLQSKAAIIGLAILGGSWTEVRATAPPDWVRTSAPLQLWSGVACSADGSRIVASSRFASMFTPGAIYISTNSGRNWQLTSAPIQYWNGVASSANGTRLIAFGAASDVANSPIGIYISANSGATWTLSSAPMTNWSVITSSADGTRLAAAIWGYGGIYYSTNGGATWVAGNAPFARYYQALCASADGQKLVASGGDLNNPNSRQVYLSSDSGATWTAANGPTNVISLACSANGNRVLGGAGYVGVYVSADSGQHWELSAAPDQEWLAIASSSDGLKATVVAGGMSSGPIFASMDSGKSWQQSGVLTGYFNSVACSSDGGKWIASEGGSTAGYIYALQLPPALDIGFSNNAVLVSWPASASGFVLQQNTDPGPTGPWFSVTNSAEIANGRFQVSLPCAPGRKFFRLRAQ